VHIKKRVEGVEFVLRKLSNVRFLFFLCIGICTVLNSLCSCRFRLWHIHWLFVCHGIVFVCNYSCNRNLVFSVFLVLVSEACHRCSPVFLVYLGLAFEVSRRCHFRQSEPVLVQRGKRRIICLRLRLLPQSSSFCRSLFFTSVFLLRRKPWFLCGLDVRCNKVFQILKQLIRSVSSLGFSGETCVPGL
jgi:hypothetical protein